MTQLSGEDPPGVTPIAEEDLVDLIPTFIATRSDLNIAEQANIEEAVRWAFRRRSALPVEKLLTCAQLNDLHARMFGRVWRWAGKPRRRQTNLGVEPHRIPEDTKLLLDNVQYWHRNNTYSAVEIGVRLHHGLVFIHPYRNGNGRHTRLVADLYMFAANESRFTWAGNSDLSVASNIRSEYLTCLRAADSGDFQGLIDFATGGNSNK